MIKYIINSIKVVIRKLYTVFSLLTGNRKVYIISSYGRSGSTLIWHSVSESLVPGSIFGKRKASIIEKGLWDKNTVLDHNDAALVFKTHYRPDAIKLNLPDECIRNVYIISKPSESIKSILMVTKELGIDWFRRHMKNLGVENIRRPIELLESDALNLKERIYDWSNNDYSITLKYEDLWENIDKLSCFIGRKVILPEKIERVEKKLNDDEEMLIKKTYQSIDKLYDEFDPFLGVKPKSCTNQ